MASPDPFTYELRVREDARRQEVQRGISTLPLGRQASQRVAELERQQRWSSIYDVYQSGGTWSAMRDDFLRSAGWGANKAAQTTNAVGKNGKSPPEQRTWRARLQRRNRGQNSQSQQGAAGGSAV